ncbi:hypothetical protein FSP39_016795 [Pinctada imbricata]|uniref:Nucleoside diphosphate kinase n=1 Tax=Pinctada imbricata TaxID=66713 RepID=A0AA88XX51_PINIB|nr:hypothetical protein FSP39_016795 [Pinctada imbricata]
MTRTLQLTLALLKPDVAGRPHIVEEIRRIVLNDGFFFVRSKHLYLPRSKAEEFYKEHEGRFFHNRLVSFMSSGHLWSHILARDDAIGAWRRLMGPTKVFQTMHHHPETIRGRYGLTDTRNATHGSDSEETAKREISFFFPEFDVDEWYKKEEVYFRQGSVKYCEENFVHKPSCNETSEFSKV